MQPPRTSHRFRIVTALVETFGFSPLLASVVALFFLGLVGAALLWLFLSAPPRTLTIVSGPPGSSFQRHAEKYRELLAEEDIGITLNIVPSGGSIDNLRRLQDVAAGIDIGFVQGGLVGENPPPDFVSLGTVSYQPLWIFYRGARIVRLSELAGKRLGIGAAGSGAQALARAILDLNGIASAPTTLVEQPSEEASKDFLAGKLDAIFLLGDSAPLQVLRALIRTPDVEIYNFAQADAYVRRLAYLNKIVIPQGAINVGENLPAQDIVLVGPGVELIARKGLNAAVSDELLEVAKEVHGRPGVLARRGEFPVPLEREFPLSEDALRYYKSGRSLTYDLFPFLVASLINRILVAIVPLLLVVIPAIRFLPVVYRWSVQLRIYRYYRPLLRLEREAGTALAPDRRKELLQRLEEIEHDVNALKIPASFANQFYDLRYHLNFVRKRLSAPVAG